MKADEVRAILRARFGPRRGELPPTAPVPCAWCGAAAHRPCRGVGGEGPLRVIHDSRRLAAATRKDTP